MGIKTIYTCDICSQVKGESNHWYMAKGGELTSDLNNFSMLQIIPFTKQFAANWSILCGESCILKFVSQNLNLLHTGREVINYFQKENSTEYPWPQSKNKTLLCTCEPGVKNSVNCELHGLPGARWWNKKEEF